jgi:hypothetical protein
VTRIIDDDAAVSECTNPLPAHFAGRIFFVLKYNEIMIAGSKRTTIGEYPCEK